MARSLGSGITEFKAGLREGEGGKDGKGGQLQDPPSDAPSDAPNDAHDGAGSDDDK